MNKIIAILILLLPISSFGAELVRLKHAVSVYADGAGVVLKQPEGVDCNDQSGFIIADSGNGRLLPYRFEEGIVKPAKEIKIPELSYPVAVKMNSKGEVFALDGIKRRILRIGSEGAFKGYVDATDLPASAAVMPRSFTLDNQGNFFVLDIFSGRVLVLSPEGKFLRQVDFSPDSRFISDVAVDRKGAILLIDSVLGEVFSAGKDEAVFVPFSKGLKEYVDFPVSVTADSEGRVLDELLDVRGHVVLQLGHR